MSNLELKDLPQDIIKNTDLIGVDSNGNAKKVDLSTELKEKRDTKNSILSGGNTWNRALYINHRSTYLINVFTTGGNFMPSSIVFYVTTSYSHGSSHFNSNSVSVVHKSLACATKIRFTSVGNGIGGGYLDIYCVGVPLQQIHVNCESLSTSTFHFVTPIANPSLLSFTTNEVSL